MSSDNNPPESNSQSAQLETTPGQTTIQTKTGVHEIGEDNPVRTGTFSRIDSYHTRECMYVKNADPDDIIPTSERSLNFHSDIDECNECKEIRTEE